MEGNITTVLGDSSLMNADAQVKVFFKKNISWTRCCMNITNLYLCYGI